MPDASDNIDHPPTGDVFEQINVTSNIPAAQLITAGSQATLLCNSDPANTVYLSDNWQPGQNNQSPLPPLSFLVVDGKTDVFGITVGAAQATVYRYPGGLNFFQLAELIVKTLIIAGSSGNGIFVYSGAPGVGPPLLAITTASTDPYGNPVTANAITDEGMPLLFYPGPAATGNLLAAIAGTAGTDAFGNTYPTGFQIGYPSGPQIDLIPNVNSTFNITSLLSGIIQGAVELFSNDGNQVLPGFLAAMLVSAASTKMATVLTSPIGVTPNQGIAIVLQSQNDANTDTPSILFGTITTPDNSTEVFTPIMSLSPYALLMYGGVSGVTTVTKTSGSGSISIPAGQSTTAKGETWGPSGSSAAGTLLASGAGGGSGEYAADTAFAIASPGTVTYAVGAPGGSSTLTGSSNTITAHSGGNASGTVAGTKGTGSANAIHHDGAAGGQGQINGSATGGGGASSAGPSSAGNPGANGSAGGAGGIAVSGGGAGGNGGIASGGGHQGGVGNTPGGAPGGSSVKSTTGRPGVNGQIRLTYQPSGGPVLLCSIASAAGTDQFGTGYPAGGQLGAALTVTGAVTATGGTAAAPTLITTDSWHVLPLAAGWTTLAGHPVPSYRLLPDGNVQLTGFAQHAAFNGVVAINTGALPAAYLPATIQAIAGIGNEPGLIAITTGGVVETSGFAAGSVQATFNGTYPVNL